MKNFLIFTTAVIMNSGVAYANIDGDYAIVNDSDGYVNVRDEDNANSSVIAKLNNTTPISVNCNEEAIKNANFCRTRFDKSNSGFVYKNRLILLMPSSTFTKIPLINTSTDKMVGTFSNKNVSVNVKFTPIKLDIKKTIKINPDKFGGCEVLYNNNCAFGLDVFDTQPNYTQLQNITVNFNNTVINIPTSAYEGIYVRRYFLLNNEITNNMAVYQNKKDNHLYIIGRFADGALIYSVIYEIKDGKYFRKSVWSEAI